MSKNAVKLFAAAAGAAVSGSMVLWRKLNPLKRRPCDFCGDEDIYVLKNKQGHELGFACHCCDARYSWSVEKHRYERMDPEEWTELVAFAAEQ